MSRPLRLEFNGALYHVTSRGDRREDIYLDDADRQAWLSILAQVCQRFNWVVHAYCLMSNHYHVLVETPEGNLSAGMRQLNGVYTQRHNRAHGKVGHVFQGRFKAILVDKEGYLLELARYVVLNPVRAGMVAEAADWPWSSYGAMLTPAAESPSWLATDHLLSLFAAKRSVAQQKYVDHVRAGVGLPSVWQGLAGQIFLGDEKFAAKMQKKLDKLGLEAEMEIPRSQRRARAAPLASFEGAHPEDRDAAMREAYASGGYSLAQIGRHFGVHYATVSRAVARTENEV
jgi:putative transposase